MSERCDKCGSELNEGRPEDWRDENPNNPGFDYYGNAMPSVNSDGTFTMDDQENWHPVTNENVQDEGVNPVNWTIDKLFEGAKVNTTMVPYTEWHPALDVSECENATKMQGCIYHPAPVGGWTHESEEIPTLRNEPNVGLNVPDRKANNMDSILDDLREKLSGAREAYDELETAESEIADKKEELETYIDEVESLIDSLDRLPEVSVYLSVDVSFDS